MEDRQISAIDVQIVQTEKMTNKIQKLVTYHLHDEFFLILE